MRKKTPVITVELGPSAVEGASAKQQAAWVTCHACGYTGLMSFHSLTGITARFDVETQTTTFYCRCGAIEKLPGTPLEIIHRETGQLLKHPYG